VIAASQGFGGGVAAVIDDVSRFIGGAEQADDMTLLAVRRVAGTLT
jgi:hypothetical protein